MAPSHQAAFASFDRFDLTGRRLAVAAVSGGSDSTALLLLLHSYFQRLASATRIVAVTVDHRLRPESAAEADVVGRLCAEHGIEHRIYRWTGEKPVSGLSSAARAARYALLHRAAEEAGTDIVLTGHTLDDQLETVAMRSVRGAGRGLAGMAPATLHEGRVWILRPFLDTRRVALRDFLRLQRIQWIDDPSNSNLYYERTRVRVALAQGDIAGSDKPSLDATHTAQCRRVELGERAAALIRDHAALAAPGLYAIARSLFTDRNRDGARYAFRILLAQAGGCGMLPDSRRSDALFDAVAEGRVRATLSRSVIDARRDRVWLRRESRGLPEATRPFAGMIWDGRYRLREGTKRLSDVTVAPSGKDARDLVDPYPGLTPGLVAAAAAGEPAFMDSAGAPIEGRLSDLAEPLAAPWATFLPSFDLASARAVTIMIRGREIPAPPFAGHKGE